MNYSIYIFDLYSCHFWSSPRLRPMQVVELIRKVIPLKAGMINIPQETSIFRVNMKTCWEWLGNTDLMISWANEPCGGRYRTFILVRMFDVRWLESPTNITVLTQGLKVFSPAYLWLLLFTHSNRAPLTSLAEMIVPLVNVGRSWVVRHIQLGNATYEKHVSTILFVSLWWSKCACVCACVCQHILPCDLNELQILASQSSIILYSTKNKTIYSDYFECLFCLRQSMDV